MHPPFHSHGVDAGVTFLRSPFPHRGGRAWAMEVEVPGMVNGPLQGPLAAAPPYVKDFLVSPRPHRSSAFLTFLF